MCKIRRLVSATGLLLAVALPASQSQAAQPTLVANALKIKLTSLQPGLTISTNNFVYTLSTSAVTFTATGSCSRVRVVYVYRLRIGRSGTCTVVVSQVATSTYASARSSATLVIKDTSTARTAALSGAPNPSGTILSQSTANFAPENRSTRSWIIDTKKQDITWLVDYFRSAGWTVRRVLEKDGIPNDAWFIRSGVDAHVEQHVRYASGKQVTHVLVTIGDQYPSRCLC